jgi:hypothetical protein
MDLARTAVAGFVVVVVCVSCTNDRAVGARRRSSKGTSTEDATVGGPSRCSRRAVPRQRPDAGAVAYPRGGGPVVVGLGTPGVVRYTVDTREHDGWYYYKTLWGIAPTYAGEVKIEGHQIGGLAKLLFNAGSGFPGKKLARLRFPESSGGRWRYGPSDTLIRADGCYAFRIEGDDFIDWVTFIARS